MILEKERKKIIEIALKVRKEKLVTLTFGNFSIRDRETGYVCITPSGVDYEELTPEDIVVVDAEGNIIDGRKKPSTEMPMHLEIYKKRPDVSGIIHTHSTFATAWACCGMSIPCIASEMSSLLGGSVDCTSYKTQATQELAEEVAKALESKNAALIENHGVIAAGPDIDAAFINAVIVEEDAKKAFLAKHIGVLHIIPDSECRALREDIIKNYGQK